MSYYGNTGNDPGHYEEEEEYEDVPAPKAKRKSAAGRKLVRWNPDLDQYVLLCVDHVAVKNNISIPWDQVANLVTDFMSGEAIKQHLAKIHKYRVEHGHKVPPKLDRSQRRMAAQPSNKNGSATITVRGRNNKKSLGDAEADAEPPKPGSSLLYKPPQKSNNKTPRRSNTTTAKTPAAPGRGRKHGRTIKIEDDDSDGDFGVSRAKARGGKRGRNTRREEEDLEIDNSPSKKPKTNSYLRATTAVDYAAQMLAAEDEEVDDEYHEESPLEGGVNQQQNGSSQSTANTGIYSQPPPPYPGYPTAQNTPQHGLPAAHTPLNQPGSAAHTNGYGFPAQSGLPFVNQNQGADMQAALMQGKNLYDMVNGGFNAGNPNMQAGLGLHGITGLDGMADPYTDGNQLGHVQNFHNQNQVMNTTETHVNQHDNGAKQEHGSQPGFDMFNGNGGFMPSPESLEHHDSSAGISPNNISPNFMQNGFQHHTQHQQNDGDFHSLAPTQHGNGFDGGYDGSKFDMGGQGQVLGEVGDMAGPMQGLVGLDDVFLTAQSWDDGTGLCF